MKNVKSLLSIVTLCLFAPALGNAQELPTRDISDIEYNLEAERGPLQIEDQGGMSVRFLGEEEEGALKLFIKNAASNYDPGDPTANTLNAISPAAGIAFKFEF